MTIKQNEVDGWTEEDELKFQELMQKRLKLRRGTSSYDVRFAADMLKGEAGERAVVEAFEKGEVKTIYEVSRNMKIFVEHESYGKPSGIVTSEADWWFFMLHGKEFSGEVLVGLKTDRLKRLIAPLGFDPPCGQHKASIGKRVQLTDLILPNYRIRDVP
jgi:hypothetical protein